MPRHTYASWYISSNGQPANGYEETFSKQAAIKRAKSLRSNLHLKGGGRAVAAVVTDREREPMIIYSWFEEAEGGYAARI